MSKINEKSEFRRQSCMNDIANLFRRILFVLEAPPHVRIHRPDSWADSKPSVRAVCRYANSNRMQDRRNSWWWWARWYQWPHEARMAMNNSRDFAPAAVASPHCDNDVLCETWHTNNPHAPRSQREAGGARGRYRMTRERLSSEGKKLYVRYADIIKNFTS